MTNERDDSVNTLRKEDIERLGKLLEFVQDCSQCEKPAERICPMCRDLFCEKHVHCSCSTAVIKA